VGDPLSAELALDSAASPLGFDHDDDYDLEDHLSARPKTDMLPMFACY